MVPVMIDRDDYKRQAKTLRKMVKVAHDRTIAERLQDMADEFAQRARRGAGQRPCPRAFGGGEGHG